MKRTELGILLAMVAALGSGCSVSSSPTDSGFGPACPGCGAIRGGETGNLSPPLPEECKETRTDVINIDDAGHGFSPREILRYASGDHKAQLACHPAQQDGQFVASGYSETQTTVHVDVRIDDFLETICAPIDPESDAECPSRVWARGTMSLTTEDDSLQVDAPFATYVLDDFETTFSSAVSLEDVSGTLHLRPTEARPHAGTLTADVRLSRDGMRGEVIPELFFTDDAAVTDSEGRAVAEKPIVGRWPVDDCPVSEAPFGANEARPEVGGKSLAELTASLAQGLTSVGELPAEWMLTDHGTLRFSVAEAAPESGCMRRGATTIDHGVDGHTVSTTLEVTVEGGASDIVVREPAFLEMAVDRNGVVVGASIGFDGEIVQSSSFEDEFGVSKIETLADWPFAQLRYVAFFVFDGKAPTSEGQFDVIGFDSPSMAHGTTWEHATWCVEECTTTHTPWYPGD